MPDVCLCYFGLARQFEEFVKLDGWIRRRIRMCYWKQWRHPRTKLRNLRRLGVELDMALKQALSRKGYWRLSQTPAMRIAMPNKWLQQQGLLRSRNSGATSLRFEEPPSADRHAGWCGEGDQQ